MTPNLSLESVRNANTPASILIDLQLFHFLKQPYEVFVALVNRAIDYSAQDMARDKNTIKGMSEDQMTLVLTKPLKSMGFDVHHDKNNGGHCDIVIEGGREMVWLGEAKKFSSYGQILGGYQQLTARYSTGISGQDQGALVIYFEVPNAKKKMDNWREYLGQVDTDVKFTLDVTRPLEFHSEQPHLGTGLPTFVRHLPVLLHHAPTDMNAAPKRLKVNVNDA